MRTDAEGAELAADKTDVGEIDVAGDDVADHVAHQPLPDFVGRDHQAEQVIAGAVGEQQAILAGEHAAIERGKNLVEGGSNLTERRRCCTPSQVAF